MLLLRYNLLFCPFSLNFFFSILSYQFLNSLGVLYESFDFLFEKLSAAIIREQFQSLFDIFESFFVLFEFFFRKSSATQSFEHQIFAFSHFLEYLHILYDICTVFHSFFVFFQFYVSQGPICIDRFYVFYMLQCKSVKFNRFFVISLFQ